MTAHTKDLTAVDLQKRPKEWVIWGRTRYVREPVREIGRVTAGVIQDAMEKARWYVHDNEPDTVIKWIERADKETGNAKT